MKVDRFRSHDRRTQTTPWEIVRGMIIQFFFYSQKETVTVNLLFWLPIFNYYKLQGSRVIYIYIILYYFTYL